jgi:hypothetical protein
MQKNKRTPVLLLLLVLLLLVIYAGWRILPYHPLFPRRITLHSAMYLRSPYAYPHSLVDDDPPQSLPAPEWVRLSIERENNLAIFESSTGEKVRTALGKPYWVKGCEDHFRIEAFSLPDGLSLGSITFHQPVLIAVCKGWSADQKIRPISVVIKEGPITEKDPFYMGVQCNPEGESCMVFAEALGELVGTVVDAETGEPLPMASIILSSGMGVQEFTGAFRLPVYEGFGVAYQISMPGYEQRVGEIKQYYGNKLDIMYFTNADHSRGRGGDVDLPGFGQQVDYTFELTRK